MIEIKPLPSLAEIIDRFDKASRTASIWRDCVDDVKKDEQPTITVNSLLAEYERMREARALFEQSLNDIKVLIDRVVTAEGDLYRERVRCEKMMRELNDLRTDLKWARQQTQYARGTLEEANARAQAAESKLKMLREALTD
jgi:chromosome segregation ATPase